MSSKHLAKLALTGLMTLGSAGAAYAGSTTEPGFTTGVALYAPALPEGLYVDLVPDLSKRNTRPESTFTAFTPFFVWQTPFVFADARIMFVAAPVYGNFDAGNVHLRGFYNTYLGTQGTWDLGNNWGLGIRLAGWTPMDDRPNGIGLPYGTIAPRIGVTYFTPEEHFTASLEGGKTLGNSATVGPNYLNLDLTWTRTFNKFELGVISYLSTDLDRPQLNYRMQSQAAVGALIGYNFGPVLVQAKLSTDVYQRNYRGYEKRLEFNILIPLYTPPAVSPPPRG